MDHTTSRPNYQAYLIRFWREATDKPWRAAVLKSGVEHVYHFATFESLVAFLHQRLDGEQTPGGDVAPQRASKERNGTTGNPPI